MSENEPPKPDLNPKNQAPADPIPEPEPRPSAEPVEEVTGPQDAEFSDRALAGFIDILIVVAVAQIPVLGWVAGPGYLLVRDAIPFTNGVSIGKLVTKTRAVTHNGEKLTTDWKNSCLRNISMIIPFFPLVELFVMYSQSNKGEQLQRFGDQWAKTRVIKEG